MKCDKHGVEMEWRGSLMKGGMYCVCCDPDATPVAKGTAFHKAFEDAVATGTGFMGIDPSDLQCAGSVAPDGKIVQGSRLQGKLADLAKQYNGTPPTPTPVKQPMRARHVGFSKSRVSTSDHMQAQLQSGASSSYCPYCDEYVGPEHLQALPGTQAELCRDAYTIDLETIRRGHP